MSNTNADVIKEFLISLGFNIDKPSAKKFSATVAGVTANVLKFGAVVEGAAASVVGFTAVAATQLDKLYWQAQRTGAAAEQIKSLGYAVSQVGGTVEGLNSSLENVARFLRNNPGGEGFLRNMGIQTRDANGQLRDTASLVALVGERLSGMPSYRANMYANMLGIDENTMLAMRRGMGGYASDYRQMMRTMGYNPTAAAKQANAFMTEFYRLKSVMGIGKDKIGGELSRVLTPSMEKLTNLILKHWPTIEKIIMSVVKAILVMSDILGQMVYRSVQGIQDIIGWWQRLDEGSQNLIKVFGLVAAAWWALNSKFLFSPIGALTVLLSALFLLYDDYQTWKEKGDSEFDWGKWEGALKKIKTEVTGLTTEFKALGIEIMDLIGIDVEKWSLKFEFESLLKSLGGLSEMLSHLVAALNHLNNGDFTLAWEELKQAWNGSEKNKQETNTIGSKAGERHHDMVKDWYFSLNNKLNEYLPEWMGGTPAKDKPAAEKGAKTLTRGERNNNPLNINFAKQKNAVLESGKGARFAQFDTIYNGLERTAWQLRRYFNGLTDGVKRQSVEAIVKKWAPREDKNDTEGYITRVAKALGVGRSDRLDLNNHDVMYALMNAMSPEEIGKPLPYSKSLVMAAITGAPDPTKALAKNGGFNFDPRMFDNAEANINNMLTSSSYTPEYLRKADALAQNQMNFEQNLTINITGVQSPHEAATLTEGAVQRSNAILARNLQTKVS